MYAAVEEPITCSSRLVEVFGVVRSVSVRLTIQEFYPSADAASSGPAATSFLRLGSTVRFNPSSDRAPQQGQIAFLCEHDFVDGEVFVQADNCKSDAAGTLPISHEKW